CPFSAGAEQIQGERQVKEIAPRILKSPEKKFLADTYYEYSWVHIGSREIVWRAFTNRFSYLVKGLECPYVEITNYERAGIKDYVMDMGATVKSGDSYLNGEIGFGGDHINYVYRFQAFLEYTQKAFGYLYWKTGGRYLHYNPNDVYIFSPGLIYYYGDHYFFAGYNAAYTQDRGTAHSGVTTMNFALTKKLNLTFGAAVGERLYDIYLLSPSKQYGYILYNRFSVHLTKNSGLGIGYSYSKENPDFYKRSVDLNFFARF
ncbi:MAG: YaiO family outer membrane beta-barrel protein, partial [Candidatus Omnitrophica bacterium]|nr:YaiO family outer membrane beta-barrel protein [Candidatus Omnitrophota bacterium]